jgi:hypothetical protein
MVTMISELRFFNAMTGSPLLYGCAGAHEYMRARTGRHEWCTHGLPSSVLIGCGGANYDASQHPTAGETNSVCAARKREHQHMSKKDCQTPGADMESQNISDSTSVPYHQRFSWLTPVRPHGIPWQHAQALYEQAAQQARAWRSSTAATRWNVSAA